MSYGICYLPFYSDFSFLTLITPTKKKTKTTQKPQNFSKTDIK